MPGQIQASIPAAVTRLLSARYPTLSIDPVWLSKCVQELRVAEPALNDDQVARSVRQKLLDTDLALIVPRTYCQLKPALVSATSGTLGSTGRGAILLQIEGIIEIGLSASSQLEVAEARRDVKSALNGESLLDAAHDEESTAPGEHMNGFQAQEEGKAQSNTVFPRRMLKLELSDGSNKGLNRIFAIEDSRVPSLDLNKTKLGCKLIIKGSPISKGYVLLKPTEVMVEGGEVYEKAVNADATFINALRNKLGKPPVEIATVPSTEPALVVKTQPTNSSVNQKKVFDVDELDFDEDEDSLLLAALEAEEVQSRHTTVSTANRRSRSHSASPAPIPKTRLVLPQPSKDRANQQKAQKTHPPTTTQSDPIDLLDSEDDELFARVDEEAFVTVSSRDEPIVIDSSPEP